MKHMKIILGISIVLLLINCKSSTQSNDIFVEYQSPTQHLIITDDSCKIDITSYEYDNMTSDVPSGSSVSTHNFVFDKEMLNKLMEVFETSGFFDLKLEYGAPETERYYPYSINFQSSTKKHSVLFRSNPSFESAPEGFSKVEKYILDIIEQQVK